MSAHKPGCPFEDSTVLAGTCGCSVDPAADTRSLPERYLSFGSCRAYMAMVEGKLPISGEPITIIQIKWTCGKVAVAETITPLKYIRDAVRPYHESCPQESVEDRADLRPPSGTGEGPADGPPEQRDGDRRDAPADVRPPDAPDPAGGAGDAPRAPAVPLQPDPAAS